MAIRSFYNLILCITSRTQVERKQYSLLKCLIKILRVKPTYYNTRQIFAGLYSAEVAADVRHTVNGIWVRLRSLLVKATCLILPNMFVSISY